MKQISYISFNINYEEVQRFGRQILPHEKITFFYYESFLSWFQILKGIKINTTYLWGARPPDTYAALYALKTSKKIIILQHAKNARRKKFTLKYFLLNYKKLFWWVLSILFLKVITSSKKLIVCKDIEIYYFTDEYKKAWQDRLEQYGPKFIKCNLPDVSLYGTVKDIPVIEEKINCFYVDEPLTTTLGITSKEEKDILKKLNVINENQKIHVKLHPRSNPNKFEDLDNFILVDEIYKNCNILAGYKSGLLDFAFNYDKFYRLESSNWKEETLIKKIKIEDPTYIQDVLQGIKDDI